MAAYPSVTLMGGTLFGIPVLTTRAIPTDTGDDQYVILLDASELVVADGGIRLDASDQAARQLSTTPAAGAQQLVSLWQENLRAIRVERFVAWAMARPTIVVLQDVAW